MTELPRVPVGAPNMEGGDRKPRVQSAERTIAILLAVASSGNGLKAKDIAERLGLSRQVTYHLIHTLLSIGVLRKNEHNRYSLGLAVASIVDGFTRQIAPEHLAPLVRAAVQATGETAYATGWIDGQVTVLASVRGQSLVQAAELPQGLSSHGHARGAGKLLLALAAPDKREAYLASNPLVPLTKNTITSRARLEEELERIAMQGYAIDNEEFSEGLCCMSVPVAGLQSHYALGIAVPAERFHANVDRYLARLREVAHIAFEPA